MRYTKFLAVFLTIAAIGALSACATSYPSGNKAVPEPAKAVDLERYLGRWYELARYDSWFEKNCEAATATYSMRADGRVTVVNACNKDTVDGPLKSVTGTAKVVPNSNNAKLKVTFFWPFAGNYWVLDHDENYAWTIVGEPTGKYLWVLTRDANASPAAVEDLKARITALGYDLRLLHMTKHAPG